ncbi:MAG TPA: Glu/Leu/Phe/Val dehydrogenase [Dehalococcoidia bacterium]|nr:Glu/Leu/Phe/Val dehydrogenase [Dehalococcoidia bacterium]
MKRSVFEYMEQYGHEQVVFCRDREAGLRAIIAIHDTTLGPATGGTRVWAYESEEEALIDALRLSHAMTYKYAAAGINLGGGKTTIIIQPGEKTSEALFRALGRFIDSLGGRYITGEDVGTTAGDLEYINMETDFVVGLPAESGGSGGPSPYTAIGVVEGMKACCQEVYGSESLRGKGVAVQGVGNVGRHLVKILVENGASVVVADIDEQRVKGVVDEFGVGRVGPDDFYGVECDIFSPCALGAVLNDETIPRLRCKVVAGSANNQLAEAQHGDMLHERGILYAPDFIINAGGTIADTDQLEGGFNAERAKKKVARVYDNIAKVIEISKRDGIPTSRAADRLAEERIERMSHLKRIRVKMPKKIARAADIFPRR